MDNYPLVSMALTVIMTIAYTITFVVLMYRMLTKTNGYRHLYAAFLPYIIHGLVFYILVLIRRITGDFSLTQLFTTWSSVLRLHMVLTLLMFVSIIKPHHRHEKYKKEIDKSIREFKYRAGLSEESV